MSTSVMTEQVNFLEIQQGRKEAASVHVPRIERPLTGRIVSRCTTGKVKSKTGVLKSSRSVSEIVENVSKPGDINPEQILVESQESHYSRVYEINLHGSHIKAIHNLNKFRKLRKLDLSCNDIKTIENLESNNDLRELKLYDNHITTIDNLQFLSQLCYLQLQHNQIVTIGKGLLKQKNLTELRIDNNNIDTISPTELSPCTHLTSLDIGYNHLNDISAVNSLHDLLELRVCSNKLHCLVDLSGCKKLQLLDVSQNLISDLPAVKSLHHLQMLNVSNNRISSLKSIGKIVSLNELIASNNRLSDISSSPAYYPNLQILDVCDNLIPRIENIDCVAKFSSLVELYLAGNPLFKHDSPQHSYFTTIQRLRPSLEILDKAHIKKSSHSAVAPLMRPMSAASAITVRHIEGQLNNFCDEMKHLEADIFNKFDSLRECYSTLPGHSPRDPATSDTINNPLNCDMTQTVKAPRHDSRDMSEEMMENEISEARTDTSSRCSTRQRIRAAQSFAAEHITPTLPEDV